MTTNARLKPRKAWLAALMSLVLPGFGQLYNGQVNKAIWWFAGFALLTSFAAAMLALLLPAQWALGCLALSLLISLGLIGYGVLDAWRHAKAQPLYQLKVWQTSGAYLAALLICSTFVLPLLITYVRNHLVQPFHIPSTSMQPSVQAGDLIFADMRYNCPGCKAAIQRGDIAIFTYANDRTLTFIKRIVALPGDRVQIQGRTVLINGKALSATPTGINSDARITESWNGREWEVQWTGDAPTNQSEAIDITVPDGHVFALGDNRLNTKDSRHFGPIPLPDVRGKATQVWFSADSRGVRWDRIGTLLR